MILMIFLQISRTICREVAVGHSYIGNGIELLHIAPEHLDNLRALPFHHRDPFDRLIISQGQIEDTPILSKDEVFGEYSIRCLWNEGDGA